MRWPSRLWRSVSWPLRVIRRHPLLSGALLVVLVVAAGSAPSLMRGPAYFIFDDPLPAIAAPPERPSLRLATFNFAHARGHRGHQALTRLAVRKGHLDRLAATVTSYDIDLLALQEIDGPGWWSGRLDVIAELGRRLDWSQYLRSTHVRGLGLDYGNALLSRLPLTDGRAMTWESAWASPPKGALSAQLHWRGLDITVVSLHLDPLWPGLRRRQVRSLAAWLAERPPPYVVMGDFNVDWSDGGVLEQLCRRLDLATWPQPRTTPPTFVDGRSIDWILASRELVVSSPRIIAEVPSDHRMVIVDLRLATATDHQPQQRPPAKTPETQRPPFLHTSSFRWGLTPGLPVKTKMALFVPLQAHRLGRAAPLPHNGVSCSGGSESRFQAVQ